MSQISAMSRMRLAGTAALSAWLLVVAGCHKKQQHAYTPPPPPAVRSAPENHPSTTANNAPIERPPVKPPSMKGRPDEVEEGMASWYGPPYHNRRGADGTVYDQNAMTAAHKTLPMGSMVRVTNLATGQTAEVRITDRGPFIPGRIIDLSLAAAKAIGVYRAGVAKVRVEAYMPENADPTGRWCVQIGAFIAAEDAVQLKNDLLKRYSTAKVIEFPGPTGYWVRINPQTPDRAHANQIASNIHVPDAEPYVVRLN